ncbi:hypothetical protein BV898_18611 [Hypsibius exemplaris]|uniref:Uncharacterized protein n=1 Tax=Hypsibius exemplaris TaxID=2072580 RepID=A0A9X6RN67_HYPEX|nr:hypothetical protein BV898_18611 [Hypsibius exemplaris]
MPLHTSLYASVSRFLFNGVSGVCAVALQKAHLLRNIFSCIGSCVYLAIVPFTDFVSVQRKWNSSWTLQY